MAGSLCSPRPTGTGTEYAYSSSFCLSGCSKPLSRFPWFFERYLAKIKSKQIFSNIHDDWLVSKAFKDLQPFRVECAISLALPFLLSRQGPGDLCPTLYYVLHGDSATLFLSNQPQMTVCRPADRRPTHGHTALSQRCPNYKLNAQVKQSQCKDIVR